MKNKLVLWRVWDAVVWGSPRAMLRHALLLLLLLCLSTASASFGFYVMKYVTLSLDTSAEARSAYVYAPPEEVREALSGHENDVDAVLDANAFACYGSVQTAAGTQEIRLANATPGAFLPLVRGRLPEDGQGHELLLPRSFLDAGGREQSCESCLGRTLHLTFVNVADGQPVVMAFQVVGLYDERRVLTERNTVFAPVSAVAECSALQLEGYELPQGQSQPQAIVVARSRGQLSPLLGVLSRAGLDTEPLMVISSLELGGTICAAVVVFFASFLLLIRLALSLFSSLLVQGRRRMLRLVVLGQPFDAVRRAYFRHYLAMLCALALGSLLLCLPVVRQIGPRLVSHQFPTHTGNPFALAQAALLILACVPGLRACLRRTDCPWEILDDDSDEYD